MGPPRDEAKRRLVFELYAKGLTYQEIGSRVGVSRQRIQQMTRPPHMILVRLKKRSKGKCEECGIKLRLGDGHIHHLSTVGDFSLLGNLQYLCRSCHKKADWTMRNEQNGQPAQPKEAQQ